MQAENTLKWLFLDLNSYFASVEQQDNPALRGRPVAIVSALTNSTCAIAASYEARAYGIKTGTPIYEARRMCPKLVCVPARHDVYVDYHHRIIDEFIRHAPINKIWSIDELSCRLPPRQRHRAEAEDLARRIKAGIKKNVGEWIKCSIGIAPNSFLAKVATDMQKPDGLVVLEPQALPGPLLHLKLTDLPGINVRMNERLKNAGIHSMEALWNTAPKQARQAWGSVAGERFWYNLHGFDVPETETSTSTIGHSRVLDPALRVPAAARLVARRLTVKAAARLRRKGYYATSFYFTTRTVEDRRWGGEATVPPTQDNFTFLHALDQMWVQMISDFSRPSPAPLYPPSLPLEGEGGGKVRVSGRKGEGEGFLLKKVSVGFLGLRRQQDITPDLFAQPDPHDNALSHAMDRINEKYGAETLRLGVSPRTQAGHVGAKIAFSRIPDREEFYE